MIELVPHPLHPPHAVQSVAVELARTGDGLRLLYHLGGDLEAVVIPAGAPPQRTDDLWQTTCFEAFVRCEGPGYSEYNFAPSGQWAAYGFDDYRHGRTEALADIAIECRRDGDTLTVEVELAAAFPDHALLALAAVVEEVAGAKSYWALAHRAGPPDFHHEACFALRLADIARA